MAELIDREIKENPRENNHIPNDKKEKKNHTVTIVLICIGFIQSALKFSIGKSTQGTIFLLLSIAFIIKIIVDLNKRDEGDY
jgi:hypothetical protein